MRIALVSTVFLIALAGCHERPAALLVCHNSNCTGPADPARDDSIEALKASLALRTADGRPMIDGVEVDTFWSSAEKKCLYAHDLEEGHVADLPPPSVAIDEIVKHLETSTQATFRAERFHVFLELKPETTPPPKAMHTPEEAGLHADCVLALVGTLDEAARRTGKKVEVTITSFENELLEALPTRPGWKGKKDGEPLQVRFGGIQGVPPPLSGTSRPLATYTVALDVVEAHPHWLQNAALEAYRSMGVAIGLWMFSATAETFDAIDRFQPDFVVTSEAPLVRRWLDDT